jgi:hypothetical protein
MRVFMFKFITLDVRLSTPASEELEQIVPNLDHPHLRSAPV